MYITGNIHVCVRAYMKYTPVVAKHLHHFHPLPNEIDKIRHRVNACIINFNGEVQ